MKVMKNEDIFIQILRETTGKPPREVRKIVEAIKLREPELRVGFEKHVSDKKARKILSDLRREKPGILNWLLAGAAQVRVAEDARLN
jgi:phage/plasmid-associated DNA primase